MWKEKVAPVNKVSRNNRTRCEPKWRKSNNKNSSKEQRSLGKDRVRLPRCARFTNQHNKVTQLIMPNGATVSFPVSFFVSRNEGVLRGRLIQYKVL